jgi:hypothetical protein
MKTLLFLLCILCASVAWGQSTLGQSGLSSEPQVIEFHSHVQHASQIGMGTEHRVLEHSQNVMAHGQRPLWEFASLSQEVPLGDIARALRQEHELARKAARVISN